MNDDTIYTVAMDGSKVPMKAAQVREFFAAREINGSTMLWREGLEEWKPLQAMAGELGITLGMPTVPRPVPAGRPQAPDPAQLAKQAAAEPWVENTPRSAAQMSAFGIILIVIGVLVAAYFLWAYDATVASTLTRESPFGPLPERAYNIGRMQERALGAGAGAFFVLIGTMINLAKMGRTSR